MMERSVYKTCGIVLRNHWCYIELILVAKHETITNLEEVRSSSFQIDLGTNYTLNYYNHINVNNELLFHRNCRRIID